MSEQILNWGFISTARINKVMFEPLRTSKRNFLLAVASRDKNRANEYARENNIERAYGSYADLLEDKEIDVVYNTLPNHLHAEWSIKAVEAGKHVLCEKPLALSLDDVDAISAAAQKHNRVVTEAFMYRTHVQTHTVREIVKSGKLGKIKMIRSNFTFVMTNQDDYRWKPEMGGGSLWDIGCYPLSFARTVLAAEPLEVFGWQVTGQTGIDESFIAQIRFPDNVFAHFDCSIRIPFRVFMEIVGNEASLRISRPFNPGAQETLELFCNGEIEKITVSGTPPYLSEVEDIADSILINKPAVISLTDSRANVATILALFESVKTRKPITLSFMDA
jgi:D-xylose 1-dehydrogenase (NADP+, D-xylono-1,5-lactone-forming)